MNKFWNFFRIFFSFIGGLIGLYIAFQFLDFFIKLTNLNSFIIYVFFFLLFFFIFYLIYPKFVKFIKFVGLKINRFLSTLTLPELFLGLFSILISLIISFLLYSLISKIPIIGIYLGIFISLFVFGVIVWAILSRKNEILESVKNIGKTSEERTSKDKEKKIFNKYLLDTSAIIDGRILELIDLNFLDGKIYIPTFILEELQLVADSEDNSKRIRGRRGLEILDRLKDEYPERVKIIEERGELLPIDTKLIELAKKMKAKIITTDYNLSQIAKTRSVPVLNINELSHALRKIIFPGEKIEIKIIKEGKERNQGVGYLDDGTMVVVEEGKFYIGKKVLVEVTSFLQGPTGSMIFGDIVKNGGSDNSWRR
ncbi:MAG TPA: PIN domain-containing protein [Caldisericia bacterium]|nr:PIN domain-containing protein [Caldisericia bacterium]